MIWWYSHLYEKTFDDYTSKNKSQGISCKNLSSLYEGRGWNSSIVESIFLFRKTFYSLNQRRLSTNLQIKVNILKLKIDLNIPLFDDNIVGDDGKPLVDEGIQDVEE